MLNKRLIAALCIVILALALAACGGTPATDADGGAAAPEGEAPAGDTSPGDAPAGDGAPAPDQPPPDAPADWCVEVRPHPIGQSTADTYEDASYEQVMTWFCAGSTFDDILLALETADQTETTVDDLLARRAAGTGWDQIWQELGLIQ